MIRVRGLTHRYGAGAGALTILCDVQMDVPAGGYAAVTGVSGAGKSTLLSILGGLEPVQRGSVCVGGADLAALRGRDLARFRRARVGFVFQDFGLLTMLTAREN